MKITQPQIPSHGSQWALGSAPQISFLLSRCTRLICSQRVQTPPRGPTNAVFFSALPTQPKSLYAFHDSSRWTLINVPEATCSSKGRKPSRLAEQNHIPRLVFPTIRRCDSGPAPARGPAPFLSAPGQGVSGAAHSASCRSPSRPHLAQLLILWFSSSCIIDLPGFSLSASLGLRCVSTLVSIVTMRLAQGYP